MGLKVLTSPTAFSPGSSLWVIPVADESEWTRKVDWYLNLQIRKAERHESKAVSDELEGIVQDNELDLKDVKVQSDAPLLISSQNHIPAEGVMRIPSCETAEDWLRRALAVWENLNKPSLRFFLPENISQNDVESVMPEESHNFISIVPFSTPLE